MSPSSPRIYTLGEVVWANRILDPNGGNPKDRPVVVIRAIGDPVTSYVVVGISTSPQSDPEKTIRLTHSNNRRQRSMTGLFEPSVAVANWVREIPCDAIQRRIGNLKATELLELREKITRLYGEDVFL